MTSFRLILGLFDDRHVKPWHLNTKNSLLSETLILLRRQAKLISRDPILYLGRFVMFFFANLILSFVYWDALGHDQANLCRKRGWQAGFLQ